MIWDAHVHLYGCLTARDLWERGCEVAAAAAAAGRLDAFADTYNRTHPRRTETPLNWRDFWKDENGLQRLDDAFTVRAPVTFAQFQARFDLAIALFPAAESLVVARKVLQRISQQALPRRVDLRLFVPPSYLHTFDLFDAYVTPHCEEAQSWAALHPGHLDLHWVLSIPRQPELFGTALKWIRRWQLLRPVNASWVAGVDLCGFEENDALLDKLESCQRLHLENRSGNYPRLELMIHAGETWDQSPLGEAVERIRRSIRLGAHRIAHAHALWAASKSDRQAILAALAQQGTILEVCPTSSHMLSKSSTVAGGGLVRRLTDLESQGVRWEIGSDDPGIFDTSIEGEKAKTPQSL